MSVPGKFEIPKQFGFNIEQVIVSSGLSTAALCQFMADARAMLMPSSAERFGWPFVEALARGTPVIPSDIPAHREASAGRNVAYEAPNDEEVEKFSIASREQYTLQLTLTLAAIVISATANRLTLRT